MPPYTGSKISLISTSDVRYEGTLYTIDQQESTIALQNVKQMGTENRRADKVEASSTVYEYIIFRGENIKNLMLMEDDCDHVLINDPAILEVKVSEFLEPNHQKSPEKKQRIQKEIWKGNKDWFKWFGGRRGSTYYRRGENRSRSSRGGALNGRGGRGRGISYGGYNQGYTKNHGYVEKDWTNGPDYKRQYISNIGRNVSTNKKRRGGNRESHNRSGDNNARHHIPGTGKFLERQTKDNDDADLKIPDKDFDFQGNLARFDLISLKDALTYENQHKISDDPREPKSESSSDDTKSKEKDDTSKDNSKEEIKCGYKKELFFDTLTTDRDVTERQTRPEMRELNAKTFGKIGSTYRCRSRWFRRWRGRGSPRNFRGGYNQRK